MRTAALSAAPSMAPQSGYRPPQVAAACRRGSSCVTSTRSRTHSSLRTCTTTCTLISCNWQQAAAPTSSSRSNAISLAASALNAKIAYALGLLFPTANCLPVPNILHFATLIAHHLALQFAQVLVARNLMDQRQQRAQPRQRRGTRTAHAQLLRAIGITDGGGALLSSATTATQCGDRHRLERGLAGAARSETARGARADAGKARTKRRRREARARGREAAEAAGSEAAAGEQ